MPMFLPGQIDIFFGAWSESHGEYEGCKFDSRSSIPARYVDPMELVPVHHQEPSRWQASDGRGHHQASKSRASVSRLILHMSNTKNSP